MGKIIEASELPSEEKVYLKKDILGWRVVEPWKNPETEKINWFILITGGKKSLLITAIIFICILIIYNGQQELVSNYKKIADDPCLFCKDCQTAVNYALKNINGQKSGIQFNESLINDLMK